LEAASYGYDQASGFQAIHGFIEDIPTTGEPP
jgi:hypothetical protein